MSYGKTRARGREGAGAKAPEPVPSLRGGGWGDKLGAWCPFLTRRVNEQHETGQFILKPQIYAKRVPPADPQMRRNLNVRFPLAQGAFVRDGPQLEYSPFMGNSSHYSDSFRKNVFSSSFI